MVIDETSQCLSACNELSYTVFQLECELFDRFRNAAWPILSDPECETSPPANSIRRKLWKLILDLCQTPRGWNRTLNENLEYFDSDFSTLVETHFGETQKHNATVLQSIWDSMVEQVSNGGPIQQTISNQISILRDNVEDFRIVATRNEKPHYEPLLRELDLVGADIFCTPSNIKKQRRFSCLITTGPFREADFIFTAPRYDSIINVRWNSDQDIVGFPDYLTNRPRDSNEPKFPDDFPVQVTDKYMKESFSFAVPQIPIEHDEWSFDNFEQIYVSRQKRQNRMFRTGRTLVDPKQDQVISPSANACDKKFVKLTFFNGATILMTFDQQNKPPLLQTIDPEVSTEIVRRRPVECFSSVDELPADGLFPGMLVIIEPSADIELKSNFVQSRELEKIHLPRWKQALRTKLEEVREQRLSIGIIMGKLGLDQQYRDIGSSLKRWSTYVEGKTNASINANVFKKVVSEFAGYEQWEKAWEEINNIWNDSISAGLIKSSKIDRYLVHSVKEQIDDVVDNQMTLLDVQGFLDKVVVIEVAEIAFLTAEQIDDSLLDQIVGLILE